MEPSRSLLRLVPRDGLLDERPPSLEWVYRKHAAYVAAIAMRLVGRDGEVDDIVQEVFLQSMTGLNQLRDVQAVKGWLATVTVRVARRRLRIRKLKSWVGLDGDTSYDTVVSEDASPEQQALLSKIYTLLDEMPVEHRLAWTLRIVDGQDLQSVASMCGCSLATAKRRITSAQERIEKELRDE